MRPNEEDAIYGFIDFASAAAATVAPEISVGQLSLDHDSLIEAAAAAAAFIDLSPSPPTHSMIPVCLHLLTSFYHHRLLLQREQRTCVPNTQVFRESKEMGAQLDDFSTN